MWTKSLPLLVVVLAASPASAALRGDQILCSVDRPCIDEVTAREAAIALHWHADGAWDRFVVRWSAPGQPEAQAIVRAVGQEGVFSLPRPRPGVAYAIRIQGCQARRPCSPDESQSAAIVSLAGMCPDGLPVRHGETCVPPTLSQAAAKDDHLAEKQFSLPGLTD